MKQPTVSPKQVRQFQNQILDSPSTCVANSAKHLGHKNRADLEIVQDCTDPIYPTVEDAIALE